MTALRRELPFALVCVVTLVGLIGLVAFPHHWLRDVTIVAIGFGLGGLLRLVLPKRRAGLLAKGRGAQADIPDHQFAGADYPEKGG